MDDDHQHTVPHHRNTGVEALLKSLEALDTMRVKRVTMSVIHVSEIGLAVDNVLAQVAEFKDRLGIEPHRGASDDTFTAVGDIYGLFIVVKIGRFWFPTDTDAAPVAPVKVTIEGAQEQHYHVSPYPYEIDVVAKTSRS